MARFIRPQFSLATLLIAMAWSGVAVWVNITPRPVGCETWVDVSSPSKDVRLACGFAYGWPWECYSVYMPLHPSEIRGPAFEPGLYLNLPWNAAVGLVLVVVLTWISSLLLRRITAKLRRRATRELKA